MKHQNKNHKHPYDHYVYLFMLLISTRPNIPVTRYTCYNMVMLASDIKMCRTMYHTMAQVSRQMHGGGHLLNLTWVFSIDLQRGKLTIKRS